MNEDLDLKALAQEAIESYRQERAEAVRTRIKHVLGKLSSGRGTVTDCERQLAKAKDRLAKEENKLQQILVGNWSVLSEDKKEEPCEPA